MLDRGTRGYPIFAILDMEKQLSRASIDLICQIWTNHQTHLVSWDQIMGQNMYRIDNSWALDKIILFFANYSSWIKSKKRLSKFSGEHQHFIKPGLIILRLKQKCYHHGLKMMNHWIFGRWTQRNFNKNPTTGS